MKSVLRFPAIIIAFSTSILCAESEDRILTSIENLSGYYPMLPELVNPFPPQNKTLCLKSTHPFWNGHFLKPTKKLRKIKKDDEAGLIDETFVLYHRWEDFDLQIPAIVTVDWYRPRALKTNEYEEFKKGYIKKLTKKTSGSGGRGKGISLINTQIGETDVELNISGNISVNGALVFENKDLVTTNIRESKSWDLEIEQTQRFSIDGNIGDRFFVKIKQDSEADFTWENDLTIEYRGHKNDILQKAEAGNINLSLEGMESVNLGGANSSLFGLKAVHQLGPVEIQSVIAREQVKKSEKSMEGGAEAGAPTNINEYNFINDRYFFIDDRFKRNYYPLTETNNHIYDSEYVLGKYEVFQKVTTAENDIIQANAYLDPGDSSSYSVGGTWVRLEENMDYEIERLLGYIRLNSVQNAIAIAYSTTFFNQESQTFGTVQDTTNGTNFKSVYDACKADNPENYQEVCEGLITLKLLKDINPSTPNSPTWPLMFKNVYSLGGSNIDPSGLEIEIIRDLGGGDERTHTDGGESYLSVFGLDSEDENHQKVEGGDGKVDLYGSFLNLAYGELMIPAHLPFSFDETPRTDHSGNPVLAPDGSSTFWGLNEPQLQGILENELIDADGDFADETDTGPAMYFDTNQDKKNEEHEFIIRVKTSTRSSSMSLGFMIVEGSETVRLGGEVLQKDVDYTIDYFSGTINFINPQALDPTAEISVSYEENELISFDQKLLVGSHIKYGFGERNYLAGGMFYYNQSIADEKVDIGYEPMRNFVWNIKGKYQNELGFITRAVDYLPLIETTKPSVFSIEGDYAQINPNPNPLGQAFIDDFESAKRTSSFSLMMRQWKMASAPLDSSLAIQNRSRMIWYNPYEDELTKNIWPEQSTSTRANNNTTKTMIVETRFSGDPGDSTFWNGLMIPLYVSEHDQSLSKYMDVWLNTESVTDDSFKIHFDIGHISEDRNGNSILDTEDEPVYGPGMGDGILSDGEDMGVDNCTDSFEDGWGGCLCSNYDPARYDSDLNGIYAHQDEFCLDSLIITYAEALTINEEHPDSFSINMNVDSNDPNGDNWCYNTTGCSNTNDYSRTNGTEGNGQAMGYRYPDSEDLDKNNTLDTRNEYFTFTLSPKLSSDDPESMVVAETEAEGTKTGWKLIRIPMLAFSEEGTPDWNDVPTFRIRFESESTDLQTIKIAKIELVENDWQEMGVAQKDTLGVFTEDPVFSVEVINTDESTDYKSSLDNLDIILEHDEYNDVDMKEQALVLSFLANPDFNSNDPESAEGGIESEHAALIKNTFPSLGDKANSYFAYEKMEMFIHGGDPAGDPVCSYCDTDSSEVEFLFRMGKDDRNYYEIRQPIYEGWDDKNHLDISIDKLTQLKIPTIESPAEKLLDAGFDGFTSIGMNLENGCVGADETPFGGGFESMGYEIVLDSLNVAPDSAFYQLFYGKEEGDSLMICGQNWWDEKGCTSCTSTDPNGDDFNDCGSDQICSDDENYTFPDSDGSEDNGEWDENEGLEGNSRYDQKDFNGDGIISAGEAEIALEDFDGDGIYSPHPAYDYENDLYFWGDAGDIANACGNCTHLQIKGNPSINNVQTVVMGVINNRSHRIFGKVLVNELRMTGVKQQRGRSYRVKGSLEFADLMSVSGDYKRKDADFHKLQQRLGTGSSDESYSATLKLHPNKILPTRWGIKTPVSISYSNNIGTPKYHPGSDILTDANDPDFDISTIQTITEKRTFSTSFKKTSRSTNWFIKRSLDNIDLNFSAKNTKKSNNQILNEIAEEYTTSSNYSYKFGKENYLSPFAFTKDWLFIGSILGEARYYYTPDKFSAKISFVEKDTRKIQRVSPDDTTKSYSFNMDRSFSLNHKFTKSLSSNYSKNINSNLDAFRDNKWSLVENMNPGLVKAISEKLTNTYSPDFMRWLSPTLNYNPTYTWNLNIIDTLTTANIKSTNSLKAKVSLSFKEIIELVYTPENKGRSSGSRGRGRGRGRSRSSSSASTQKKINVKNPALRFILGGMHTAASKLNKISATYNYTTSQDYSNIPSDLRTSYLYRLGLQRSPLDTEDSLQYITSNNLVGSSSSSFGNDVNVSTSINITRSIVTNLDFKYKNSLTVPSAASTTKSESYSFYPLGMRGDEGLPLANWSVNWSGIEKWWFMDKIFKSITISHGFNGERSESYRDGELQNRDFNLSYAPILGITTKSKGRYPITFKVNYNLNQSMKNSGESTERNHKSGISSSISFKKSGGLNIPIFFFRDFYIPNDMDFALNFNWDKDQKLMTSTAVSSLDEFNEQSNNTSWSLKPNVTYSFTRWVNGNFYFVYGITENKTTGRNEEKDFGFNLNIKIQG